jgi:hypothetical protein
MDYKCRLVRNSEAYIRKERAAAIGLAEVSDLDAVAEHSEFTSLR